MEVALVVEAGERVRLGELARLAVPARVLDRGHRALGEALGLLDLVRARLVVGSAPEERERPDRAELAAHQRDEGAAADERRVGGVAVTAVAVADGDRPGEGARDARGRRPRGLLRRHAARHDGGRAVLALDDHHRRVERRDLHRRVEDAIHELLEVDRAAELAEEPVAPALPLGAVERLREVAARARPSSCASRRPRARAPGSSVGGRRRDGREAPATAAAATTAAATITTVVTTPTTPPPGNSLSLYSRRSGDASLERGTPRTVLTQAGRRPVAIGLTRTASFAGLRRRRCTTPCPARPASPARAPARLDRAALRRRRSL